MVRVSIQQQPELLIAAGSAFNWIFGIETAHAPGPDHDFSEPYEGTLWSAAGQSMERAISTAGEILVNAINDTLETVDMLPAFGDASDIYAFFTNRRLWTGRTITQEEKDLIMFAATMPGFTGGQQHWGARKLDEIEDISQRIGIKISGVLQKKGTSVLGKYDDYINLASGLGAKKFNIPTNIWNKMTATERWAANQKFLDRMILRGDNIILSNRVTDIDKVTGTFRKELDYLIKKGYRLNDNGLQMIK